MKKKLLATALSLSMALSITACGGSDYDFVTLPEYKGIPVATIEVAKVTDTDVTARIQSNLNAHIIYEEVTDRAVVKDDIVNMDITGLVNGSPYTGSEVKGYDIKIGSESMVPGFDAAIIGRKIGDSFTINLEFPKDYHISEIAGKPVEYKVAIHGIRAQIMPELSDSFVKKISTTATTVEEYQLEVRKQLENEQADTNKSNASEQVWNHLISNVVIEEYPKSLLNDEVALIEDQYIRMADLSGVSLEVYVTNNLAMDQDTFKSHTMSMAEYNLLERGTIMSIAEKENLIPTEEEYFDHYQNYLDTYGFADVQELLNAIDEDTLKTAVLTTIVKDFLVEHSVQTDKAPASDEIIYN